MHECGDFSSQKDDRRKERPPVCRKCIVRLSLRYAFDVGDFAALRIRCTSVRGRAGRSQCWNGRLVFRSHLRYILLSICRHSLQYLKKPEMTTLKFEMVSMSHVRPLWL